MDEDQLKDEEVDEEVVDQTQDEAQEATEKEAPEEVQQEEQSEDNVEEQQEAEPEVTEEPAEQTPSRREQLRIQTLLKKYGNPEQRQAPQATGVDYRDMIDADENVYEQLAQRSQQYGQEQYSQGVARAEFLNWNTNLKVDTPVAHQKYPQLSSNDRIRDSINEEYLQLVGYNPEKNTVAKPEISYLDFVEARFEQAQELAAEMTERTRTNVIRQQSRTGIRPGGASAKRLDLNKDPGQMSDEELKAKLKTFGM